MELLKKSLKLVATLMGLSTEHALLKTFAKDFWIQMFREPETSFQGNMDPSPPQLLKPWSSIWPTISVQVA